MDNDVLVDLIARCALKDQRALEQLYDKTAGYLNAIAYRIVGSTDISNDVLQEAFVQIWDNASSYMPSKASPLTWMGSLVRYRAIDKLKQDQRHNQRPPTDEEEDILNTIASSESPDSNLQRHQMGLQISGCLKEMNDKFRRCVELAYLYGYSREELAEHLDSNINTVKSWLKRGSTKLKECLQQTMEGAQHVD